VTWCIDGDEPALVGREEAVGDVYRDALLAFGGEAVEQQRQIEVSAACSDLS
jgi:hypothetical protein